MISQYKHITDKKKHQILPVAFNTLHIGKQTNTSPYICFLYTETALPAIERVFRGKCRKWTRTTTGKNSGESAVSLKKSLFALNFVFRSFNLSPRK